MKAMTMMGLGAMLVLGCGGGGPAGSCQIEASAEGDETCVDFEVGYSSGDAMEACSLAGDSGTYSDAQCSTTDRVGQCVLSSPDGAFTQINNYYAPTTVEDAEASCDSFGGAFSAE